MQSPPLQSSSLHLVSHTHYYCGGNVKIAPTVAIASGVVLQALPGGSIEIQSGACLGAGVVIQVKHGKVLIGAGASLGTGVLVVGSGSIGQGACVGPASTLINPAIPAQAVVPPHSLWGNDPSHTVEGRVVGRIVENPANPAETQFSRVHSTSGYFSGPRQASGETTVSQPVASGPAQVTITPRASSPVSPKPVDIPEIPSPAGTDVSTPMAGGSEPNARTKVGDERSNASLVVNNQYVYGRHQVNGLLSALFPHRQPLNGNQTEEEA
jgi:carbon dioxide concentrating mechanism protein CcmN